MNRKENEAEDSYYYNLRAGNKNEAITIWRNTIEDWMKRLSPDNELDL